MADTGIKRLANLVNFLPGLLVHAVAGEFIDLFPGVTHMGNRCADNNPIHLLTSFNGIYDLVLPHCLIVCRGRFAQIQALKNRIPI